MGRNVGSFWGNANTWDSSARGAGYTVSRTPRAGAVFQTDSGYYGHVGIVESVNPDGTINISDMNGIAGWNRVGYKNNVSPGGYWFIY
jgi:surface antigen